MPVSIVGTFALFPLVGFSINMTSMFGLVLAIGIVVDDAMVLVEAVQHKIDQGMSPRDATIQAMEEVSSPVVAIACILAAVFIPVVLLGGISGQIHRQFALTIAASVLLSGSWGFGWCRTTGSSASSQADTLKERNGEPALYVSVVQGGESHD